MLVAPTLAPSSAHAQATDKSGKSGERGAVTSGKDKAAREMFNAGRAAYDEALYEDALSSFKRAYELSGRPALLFNIGQAADRARRDDDALDAFEKYLQLVPEAENRRYVEERIATLKRAKEPMPVAAPAATDLSPAAAASASTQSEPAASAPAGATQRDQGDDSGVVSKWWFWTAVGAGVAAVVVTTVVLSSQDPELQRGDVGGVVQTAVQTAKGAP